MHTHLNNNNHNDIKAKTPKAIQQWTTAKNAHIQPCRTQRYLFGIEKYYPAKEIQKHNTKEDGWIVDGKGSVYDITALFIWLDHPGITTRNDVSKARLDKPNAECETALDKMFTHRLGKIITTRNDKFFHGKNAQAYWNSMRIGQLALEDAP